MAEPNSARLTDVRTTIKSGFRVHARKESRRQSVSLAEDLSNLHDRIQNPDLPTVGKTTDIRAFFTDVDRNLQRTRKTIEVIEEGLEIGLGHSKLARIAMTGAQLHSGVALVVASHNLLISADNLHRAHTKAESIQKIAPKQFHSFYRAIGLVIAEAILFSTPLNFRIAWRGTRYLNNRYLYTLRYNRFSGRTDELLKGIHRLFLSETHYAIRGILPTALRTPEEFTTYLVSMVTQTISLLRTFANLKITEISAKAESLIQEYQTFVEDTYNITTADVDIESIIQEVVSQFSEGLDFFALSMPRQDSIL